ncbi:hypothetical protein [Pseudonocardia alaniniphila]|uniref:ABC-2 type transport system permease protein n=1 Tax=Pseudonocardia alaniniphila TaxID=75291 RepID=A0ABS9TCE7_9PSEU|nr:hypothetical protein [Pseudonocardia alaniniphila]MCH6165966.1 hypothetical protein [Pseudonocardia alaniniphila]
MTTRTLAVARYVAADVVRSQRVLIPVVVYGVALAVVLSDSVGRPPGVWPATALALYPTAAWLTLVVANIEAPAQRLVTMAAAGGPVRLVTGTVLVALAADAVLVLLSVVVPVVRAADPYPAEAVLSGVLVHVAAATTGTAIGTLCARPVVTRIGWSFLLAVSVVTVTAVQPWLPPVGSAVRALTSDAPPPLGEALLGLLFVAAAAAVAVVVDRRA